MQAYQKQTIRLISVLAALVMLVSACKPSNLSTPKSITPQASATSADEYVATVNGVRISVTAFQKLVRYYRFSWVSRYQQYQAYLQMFGSDPTTSSQIQQQLDQIKSMLDDSESLGEAVVNAMVDTQLIRQEAARRGITVTAEEVEQNIQQAFSYYPNGTPTPGATTIPDATATPSKSEAATLAAVPSATPSSTPTEGPTDTPNPTATAYTVESFNSQFQTFVDNITSATDLTEADLRTIVEDSIYRTRLAEVIGADAVTEELQIHARHILVADEATANEVVTKLNAGEDWNNLAATYSTDTYTAQNGGDLGWFGKGVMDTTFETTAFATAVGTTSAPVQTSYGWHIIQVLESGNRPLSADTIAQNRETRLQEWLTSQHSATGADGQPIVVINDNYKTLTPNTPVLPVAEAAATATTAP